MKCLSNIVKFTVITGVFLSASLLTYAHASCSSSDGSGSHRHHCNKRGPRGHRGHRGEQGNPGANATFVFADGEWLIPQPSTTFPISVSLGNAVPYPCNSFVAPPSGITCNSVNSTFTLSNPGVYEVSYAIFNCDGFYQLYQTQGSSSTLVPVPFSTISGDLTATTALIAVPAGGQVALLCAVPNSLPSGCLINSPSFPTVSGGSAAAYIEFERISD